MSKPESEATKDVCASGLAEAPCSHPKYRMANSTAGATFTLSSGAKLSVARGTDGVFIAGQLGEVKQHMAISHEGAETLLAALLLSRPSPASPLPYARLLPIANIGHEPRAK